jgi:hypothetical protein
MSEEMRSRSITDLYFFEELCIAIGEDAGFRWLNLQFEAISSDIPTQFSALSKQKKSPLKVDLLSSSSHNGRDIPKAIQGFGVENFIRNAETFRDAAVRSPDRNCNFGSFMDSPEHIGQGKSCSKSSGIKQTNDCNFVQFGFINRTPSFEAKLGLLYTDAAHVILDRGDPPTGS